MTVDATPRWLVPVAVAGIVGVSWYVASWVVAGLVAPGYDPVAQAISELFAVGAPRLPALLLTTSLVGSGIALIAFGPVLHRGLPGEGLAGPAMASLSGVMTVAIVWFPCSAGCPGAGTSTTDTMHTVVAGAGYLALVVAPLLTAARVRGHDLRLARWSVALGVAALAGFAVRAGGWWDATAGLQQRAFNTVADVWYVVAAVAVVRWARRPVPARRA